MTFTNRADYDYNPVQETKIEHLRTALVVIPKRFTLATGVNPESPRNRNAKAPKQFKGSIKRASASLESRPISTLLEFNKCEKDVMTGHGTAGEAYGGLVKPHAERIVDRERN